MDSVGLSYSVQEPLESAADRSRFSLGRFTAAPGYLVDAQTTAIATNLPSLPPARRIFFIGGVHGSGKSTLCRHLAAQLGVDHVTASELLRFVPGSCDTTKAVHDVEANQIRLLAALEGRVQTGRAMILDGHFCLLGRNQQIETIPESVFAAIQPIAMVLVEASAEEILGTLHHRGSLGFSLGLMRDLLLIERQRALQISAHLAKPLLIWQRHQPPDEVFRFLQGKH